MLETRGTAEAFGQFLDANVYKVAYLIGTRGEKASQGQIDARLASSSYAGYHAAIRACASKWLKNGFTETGEWTWADCMGWLEMFWNGGWFNKPLTRSAMKYPDTNTGLMYALAIKEGLPNGAIATLPKDCPYPIAVCYPGHVGFYYKGLVYQSAGHCPGTIKSTLSNTSHNKTWLNWYMIPYLDYKGWMPNKQEEQDDMIKMGSKGTDVTLWQRALMNAGYPLPKWGADGSYGNETLIATNTFKRDAKITPDPDGTVGFAEWSAMVNMSGKPTGITQEQLDAEKARADKAVSDLVICTDQMTAMQGVIDGYIGELTGVANALKALDVIQTKY